MTCPAESLFSTELFESSPCTLHTAIENNVSPPRVVVKDRFCGAMSLVRVEDMFQWVASS